MVRKPPTIAVIALLCAEAIPVASAPPAQVDGQTTKIRAKTELVEVPVIARRGGKHVEGLSGRTGSVVTTVNVKQSSDPPEGGFRTDFALDGDARQNEDRVP